MLRLWEDRIDEIRPKIAAELRVEALVVVDSDLRSILPEWIELLAGPILKGGFDYVSPRYERHKYDGTITNSIVYPLTRALYGQDVRQPIGGDFGFSGRLAAHFVRRPVWETSVARFGIDPANMFEFWDWVGGRYSMDSSIGLSTMIALGPRGFRDMLAAGVNVAIGTDDQHPRCTIGLKRLDDIAGL